MIDGLYPNLEEGQGLRSVKISDDKKADLINSLLVVMTSEKESNPVISVGR